MRRREVDPEKLQEMIRSILPSRARVSARAEKAANRRGVRRSVRQALHSEDAEETPVDLTADANQWMAVWNRRSADKLNHFMRWCEALTEGLSDSEAVDFVRGILPDNLIGDHALSHWEAYCRYGRGKAGKVPRREQRARMLQSFYDRTRNRLRAAMHEDPDFLGNLNARLKARRNLDENPRLLHGEHEIDDYVRALVVDGALPYSLPLETTIERWILFDLLDEHARQSGPKRPIVLLGNVH
jgi:hypothetical protein